MSTNPFLSFAAEPNAPETTYNVFQNNPFANFNADQNVVSASDNSSSNPFLSFLASASTESQSTATSGTAANPFSNFFVTESSSTCVPKECQPIDPVLKPTSEASRVTVVRPSPTPPPRPPPPSLPGSRSGSRRSSFSSDYDDAQPPRRPPPPRSSLPKETEDMILSVTGTLEATSSDLLDRLQATRTPSPTPLEELHSPGLKTTTGPDIFHRNDDRRNSKDALCEESASIFDAIASLSKSAIEEKHYEKPPLPPPPIAPQPPAQHLPQMPPSRPPPPPLPVKHIENDLPDWLGNCVAKSDQSCAIPPETAMFGLSPAPPYAAAASRKTSYDFSSVRPSTPPSSAIQKKYSLDHSALGDVRLGEATMAAALAASTIGQERTILGGSTSGDGLNTFDSKTTIGSVESINKTSADFTSGFMTDGDVSRSDATAAHSEASSMIFDDIAHPSLASVFAPSAVPSSCAVTWPGETDNTGIKHPSNDLFGAFEQKFENFKSDEKRQSNVGADPFDPFGDTTVTTEDRRQFKDDGFGAEASFDEFLALDRRHSKSTTDPFQRSSPQCQQPHQQTTKQWPAKRSSVSSSGGRKPSVARGFDDGFPAARRISAADSTETPPTPLFDDDISQPLEPFPRSNYTGSGWNMEIRYPIRKKFTGQRFWKKVFVRLAYQGETPHLELLSREDSKQTVLHEWPLQPSYAISDIGAQQYDQYGKIFTVKVQFVMYKERPGVRPGQITKAERLTNKLSQFATYAIQGDYQGVKEFGSDLKKLGLPVEHSPQITLICKLGSHEYEDMKQFSVCVEDALFKLSAHRENIRTGINYKMEEMQITAVDELYVEQNSNGSVTKQLARVRLFFLGFLTGMPDIEIGVNDLRRQGKEIVGRHDIIPVITEEWIRLENVEFHECIQQDVYEETKTIKLKPPDACYLELMRFRVRPPKNRELPIQLKTVFRTCGNKVDIAADIIVPGFTSRKLGQIPCEDVAVRIPIPESWIYLFRVEKHFRYGSVKSAHRRTGKIKGIERFLGAVDTLESHLIEVTSGHAKYEHNHKAIVWRISRLPKEGQGAYTTHNLECHLALTSYDQIPDELAKYCFVEFTMPITQVSHMTVRSVSISNSDSDSPPEKYVRHLARHEYRVEIEHTQADTTNDYIAATMIRQSKPLAQTTPTPIKKSESALQSDSDSD